MLDKRDAERYSRCTRERYPSLISGEVMFRIRFCDMERNKNWDGACGEEGKYWEPK